MCNKALKFYQKKGRERERERESIHLFVWGNMDWMEETKENIYSK